MSVRVLPRGNGVRSGASSHDVSLHAAPLVLVLRVCAARGAVVVIAVAVAVAVSGPVLSCAVLYCVVLCCAVLYYIVQCCIVA